MEELKRVIEYRRDELRKDALAGGASKAAAEAAANAGDVLALCLSSRRNMCIHPDVVDESDRERVDALCRNMTASWVRSRAEREPTVKLCEFFEQYERTGTDAELRGIHSLDDLKRLGEEKGWCPYFLARHAITFANVVVFNYQYMLDPKIANLVSREMEDKSIVIFDEAHNIDNVCIEALSVTLDRGVLEGASRNLGRLAADVERTKVTNIDRLRDEYARLARGMGLTEGGSLAIGHSGGRSAPSAPAPTLAPPLSSASRVAAGGAESSAGVLPASSAAVDSGAAASASAASAASGAPFEGGEELPGAPVLPTDVAEQAIPGNIRNAELFVRFMRHVVRFLKDRIKVAQVETETPAAFLLRMGQTLAVDPKPLRFAYSRLNSLLRTLEVTDMDDFGPLQLVADFATLLTTYPVGFMVIMEPYNSKTPHIPDPIMQLACLDASLAVKPVFHKFQSVILTSGTLSPLDMYPKILNFNPVVRASFEMSLTRPCICPLIVSRGSDQTPLTTRFESRDDHNVMRNYGEMLVQLVSVVPDGVVAFFPSYSFMETAITAWHSWKILQKLEAQKLLFIETKDIVETTLSLGNFKRACDCGRGALYFSVARGKVAEGIDFDRHYGRMVVLIGVPYQYTLSHVLRARLAYMRDNYHIREQDFLTFDALRQSSQCVGRVIRSKRDYGIMVFADARYARTDKRSKLPQWVQQALSSAHLNLSSDLATGVATRFLKDMAQPLDPELDLGHSLLSLDHIRELEAKRSLEAAAAGSAPLAPAAPAAARMADEVAGVVDQPRYPGAAALPLAPEPPLYPMEDPSSSAEGMAASGRFTGIGGFLDDDDDNDDDDDLTAILRGGPTEPVDLAQDVETDDDAVTDAAAVSDGASRAKRVRLVIGVSSAHSLTS